MSTISCPKCKAKISMPGSSQMPRQPCTEPISQPPPVKREPRRIGGWLILPAIGLVASPILGLIGILATIESMTGDKYERLTGMYPGYSAYSGLYLVVRVALLAFVVVVAINFFKKRAATPLLMIGLMITQAVCALILFLIGLAVFRTGDELVIVSLLRSNNFIGALLWCLVWIPYLLKSKRVEETFVT
jgi:phosphotransferase system  glucose/maltose/N-acetylglucosamine-specific IIC component